MSFTYNNATYLNVWIGSICCISINKYTSMENKQNICKSVYIFDKKFKMCDIFIVKKYLSSAEEHVS